ncbi:MAG: F0F1 ATP synthase subunit B [Elusimicrobiaceae bacterium]|nr:F0F1 ATP synthase subunit B [Elusimicrobiaceae bacterium]
MENLLNPDFGVMALTIVNFLLLVWLLHKFAWKGLIGALEKREKQIAEDKAAAAQARQEAQQIKADLDAKLQDIASQAAQKVQEAVALGNAQKEQILAETQRQAEHLIAQAKVQIEAEKNKALSDVRAQVVSTALLAAAKITQQQIDQQAATRVVDAVLQQVQESGQARA